MRKAFSQLFNFECKEFNCSNSSAILRKNMSFKHNIVHIIFDKSCLNQVSDLGL